MSAFLSDMKWRGLLQQVTDEPTLDKHLASVQANSAAAAERRAYVGFDPTADSLTIGNLVGIMALARFQRAGHTPFALMGGATGLIGDPSGKSAERTLNTREVVEANVQRIQRIFSGGQLLDFSPTAKNKARIVNNIDWLGNMGFLEALREIGKHFSVNMMIQKDSVKERLTNRDQGISYTEFSYMLLQGYDFAYLCEKEGVTLQMGGSDQFGNIVVGADLIRKRGNARAINLDAESLFLLLERSANAGDAAAQALRAEYQGLEQSGVWHDPAMIERKDEFFLRCARGIEANPSWFRFEDTLLKSPSQQASNRADIARFRSHFAFGLTWPLVTKADGTKFGKTESGAIWLTADRTSPYAYYQFWLNAADADVVRLLKTYTFLSQGEIAALEHSVQANPGARDAQRALAREATRILHGETEMLAAEAAAKAVFSGDLASLPLATLQEALASAPGSTRSKAKLEGPGESLLDLMLLPEVALASSKREAREFLQAGAVTINGRKAALEDCLTASDLLHNTLIVLKRGKKNTHVLRYGG